MRPLPYLSEAWNAISSVIWPRICPVCGKRLENGQTVMCLACHIAMPRFRENQSLFNSLHQRLAAPGVPIDRAYAWMRYLRHSPYRAIIIDAKYNDLPSLARHAGRLMATELGAGAFAGIDALVAVPMSPWKQVKRGYNQAEEIAKGISMVAGIPVRPWLTVVKAHDTQTHRSAQGRLLNARGSYAISDVGRRDATGKHVMVVDDVVTTGSTMVECLRALAPYASALSVAALGATQKQ